MEANCREAPAQKPKTKWQSYLLYSSLVFLYVSPSPELKIFASTLVGGRLCSPQRTRSLFANDPLRVCNRPALMLARLSRCLLPASPGSWRWECTGRTRELCVASSFCGWRTSWITAATACVCSWSRRASCSLRSAVENI